MIAKLMSNIEDSNAFKNSILESLLLIVNADRCLLYLIDKPRKYLYEIQSEVSVFDILYHRSMKLLLLSY